MSGSEKLSNEHVNAVRTKRPVSVALPEITAALARAGYASAVELLPAFSAAVKMHNPETDVSYAMLLKLLNGKSSFEYEGQRYTNLASELALFLCTEPQYLFGELPYDSALPLEELCVETADGFTQPEDALRQKQHTQAFENCLSILAKMDPRGEQALRLHFGLDSGEPMTFKQAGEVMGIGAARVGDLEARALYKLRQILFQGYGAKYKPEFWTKPELSI